MKNSELVATSDELDSTETQRQFLSRKYVEPILCGVCGDTHSQERASGVKLDDIDWAKSLAQHSVGYHCPMNGVDIRYYQPLASVRMFVGYPSPLAADGGS